MSIAPRQTLASAMYDQLRDDIVTVRLAPQSKLKIHDLCERFDVGLSPVREALSRLSMEGLVQQIDRRGFRVADVSVLELADLTKARCWVNETALTQSILYGGTEWEESVLIAYHRLARTSPEAKGRSTPGRAPEWEKAHHVFHTSLISGCGSQWMIEMCERLFDASERYRHVGRLAGVKPGGRDEEHCAIMRATIDRDVASAVGLLNQHYQKTAELVWHVVGGDAKSDDLVNGRN